MQSLEQQADALEDSMMRQLDRVPTKSVLYTSGDVDPTRLVPRATGDKLMLMGDDPRLKKMPDKPTLIDFFRSRFGAGGVQHLLQSANLARKAGHNEKVILACLLHDIAVAGLIRADHGYWGAQLVE